MRAVASAQAVKAGTDLECGSDFRRLTMAVQRGLLTEADLDRALTRLFTARMRLGMFDPPERVAYARIPYAVNDSPPHRAFNREVARKSLVLLENDGMLPFAPTVKRLAVIGPTADDLDAIVGNYNGTPSAPITILAGLRQAAAARGVVVTSARGSDVNRGTPEARREAVDVARASDAVVMVLGLTPRQEGEEGEDKSNPGGDRLAIELPAAQLQLFDEVAALGKPIVVVLTGGSAQAIPTIKARANAVLAAWYAGGEGGGAVADVLFGDADPGGRLPITFYASTADLPAVQRLLDARTHVSLFLGTAVVAVRTRPQLHDVPVRRPARRVSRHAGRAARALTHGHEHRPPYRRRRGARLRHARGRGLVCATQGTGGIPSRHARRRRIDPREPATGCRTTHRSSTNGGQDALRRGPSR